MGAERHVVGAAARAAAGGHRALLAAGRRRRRRRVDGRARLRERAAQRRHHAQRGHRLGRRDGPARARAGRHQAGAADAAPPNPRGQRCAGPQPSHVQLRRAANGRHGRHGRHDVILRKILITKGHLLMAFFYIFFMLSFKRFQDSESLL